MDSFWWHLAIAARLFPAVLLVPAFGSGRVPLPARIALVASLSWALAPATGGLPPPPSGAEYVLLVAREVVTGCTLALGALCSFEAVAMAGALVDTSRGASRPAGSGLIGEGSRTGLERLYLLIAVLVFFSSGGPGHMLAGWFGSYRLVPLDGPVVPATVGRLGSFASAAVASAVQAACGLALPVMAAVFLADCVLGLVNRQAPAIPVFFLGMPLKAILGIAATALSLASSGENLAALF